MKHSEYKNNTLYTAFTRVANNGLFKEILVPVKISLPTAFRKQDGESSVVNAIWDTGATNCVISNSLAQKMKLIPVSFSLVSGVHGVKKVPVYLLDINLPNDVQFLNWNVSEGELSPGRVDFLIGMDIIARGDSSLTQKTNLEGKPCTVFSFRYPSTTRPQDYVMELQSLRDELEKKKSNKELRKQYNDKKRKKK